VDKHFPEIGEALEREDVAVIAPEPAHHRPEKNRCDIAA
jgi:hypothetical protein